MPDVRTLPLDDGGRPGTSSNASNALLTDSDSTVVTAAAGVPIANSEMQRLVNSFDWSGTPLGPKDEWPPVLKANVQLLLECKLPMYLAWGADNIQIYNDAYRPILGDKHPALGQRTQDTWPEIWGTIGPMWQRVRNGESIGFENFRLRINRFGYEEDCWFNFSYSPARDASGEALGVLVTFAETTGQVRAAQQLESERVKLQLALAATGVGWWHYDPQRDYAWWDQRFRDIFGIEPDSSDNSLAIGRILEEDRARVWSHVQEALDPARRTPYSVEYRIQHPTRGVRFIEAHGIGQFDESVSPTVATALVGTVADVTESRGTQMALRESEQRQRSTAQRLALAMSGGRLGDWSWDAESDLVELSPRAVEIFGIASGTPMTWAALRGLLHPDDAESARLAVESSIAARGDYKTEYRVIKGAEATWVLAQGRPVFDGERLTGMLGIVQDISERKLLEQELRARGEALEMLHRTGISVSAELDIHKVVSEITEVATRLAGAQFGAFFYNVLNERGESYMLYTLAGVDRKHFEHFPMPRATALFGPTFRGEGVIRIEDVTKDPRFGKADTYHGMPPGHLPVLSYLAVPVMSRTGAVLGGLFFGHPKPSVFTEGAELIVSGLAAQAAVAIDNVRLYGEAKRNQQAAEAANRMKDEFLATVSHELRTPLSAISGWAHMLRSGSLNPVDHERALATIDRNVKAQRQLIDDILDASRIITGKMRVDLHPIEVVAAIEAAIESLQPLLDSKTIHLRRMFDTAAMVLGDASRLQQIVWNLLANAVKYTPRGGRVTVSVRRIESSIEICIADNGEGMDAAFLPHVFERFRQADSSTTRAHGGMGLGLAIVRHLVELHGGTVEARSEGRGKGSQFFVRLPIAPASSAKEGQVGSERGPSSDNSRDLRQPSGDRLRGVSVLIIDDEPDARAMLAAVLSHASGEVRSAASAAEALQLISIRSPDIIVSDIGMPHTDGYAFMKELRQRRASEGGDIPAVALTAYARPEDRLAALNAGFQAHVTKPIDPAELVATIASLVGRRAP